LQRPEHEADPFSWQPSGDDAPPNLNPMPDPRSYDQDELARCTEHPDELRVRGIPVRCASCSARRDWLIILHLGHVWIRCRCAHQWHEPELTVDEFDDLGAGPPDRYWPTFDQAVASMGFDGTLRGTYFQ
jgi:hypothetical protein